MCVHERFERHPPEYPSLTKRTCDLPCANMDAPLFADLNRIPDQARNPRQLQTIIHQRQRRKRMTRSVRGKMLVT